MQQLIDEDFLRRLANLRFMARRRKGGRFTGGHVSPRAGMSIEFADYREYVPGDDLRYVDWNIYGRLERLLVKTFVQELDVPVYFLVDTSASMRLGRPAKALYASRLALALGYLALRNLDRVGLFPFSSGLGECVPPRHGIAQFSRFLRSLSAIVLSQTRECGVVILISDFFGTDDLREPLARLSYRGDDVLAMQILDREDAAPSLSGPVQFQDVETEERTAIAVGPATLEAYRKRFAGFEAGLRREFQSRKIPLFVTTTDRPLEQFIHEDLRAGGVLQ
ncbi:MAG: DUF58 domain-containing protein [Candidatus Bipolaricaulota bacterium]|nr:DUF58 domain-containing protein [Candidatus Bipolaricaulota bacterium]